MKKTAITGLFFLSGALGLVYEVVWARQLALLVGVSLYSVSAVVAAFMGGLGLGAEFFGRKLDRGFAPARLYALMEFAIGIYVLLFPLLLSGMEKLYVALHPGTDGISLYVLAVRFLLAVGVLIIPTTLMGGTLPALSRLLAENREDAGKRSGWLYAVNTLGAMAGCILAGFYLIERFGLSGTLMAGAFLNIAIGAIAWGFAGEARWMVGETAPREEKKGEPLPSEVSPLFLAAFGVSGLCAIAFEVLWTRMLVLFLNNTTYAFSLILAIFLFGIGAGSAVVSRKEPKIVGAGESSFAWFQMGVGIFAILSLAGFAFGGELLELVGRGISTNGTIAGLIPGGKEMVTAFIISLLMIFPCAYLMGGSFAMAFRASSTHPERIGGRIGRLYAINIIGCVAGSILSAYLLIPLMGVRAAIMLMGWVAIISATVLLVRQPGKRKGSAFAAVSACVVVSLLVIFAGDAPFLLSLQKLDSGSRVEFYKEGPSATVLVSSQDSDLTAHRMPVKRLWINGDPIAGAFREALQLERLQAHIPLLLHPAAKNVLVICFGTGSTAGAAAAHKVPRVTAVDISPEVFLAAVNFSDANFKIANNPSFAMVEEDGRNYLLTTHKKFDFITSEPPPPSNAGIVNLYTTEYYRLCRKRLAERGIVAQWIPLHHLSPDNFRTLVAAFAEVFPDSQMWYTKWDAIMIGSNSPLSLDFAAVEAGMKEPSVAESLAGIGITGPHQLFAQYMMGPEEIRKYVLGAKPLSDDRPTVEFSSPRVHAEGVVIKGRNLESLLTFRTPPKVVFRNEAEAKLFDEYFRSEREFLLGQVELSDNRLANAAAHFRRALEICPANSDARYAFLSLNMKTLYAALGQKRADAALKMLESTKVMDTEKLFESQLHFLKGMFFADANNIFEAQAEFLEALKLDPKYFMAVVNLAGLYGFRMNEVERARELYSYALKLGPSQSETQSILDALKKLT